MVTRRQRRALDASDDDDDEEIEAEEVIERIPAWLSRCPKTLFDMWHAYQFGLSGWKPTKMLNLIEKGRTKSVYYCWKVFWDVVVNFVNAGHTSEVAINRVHTYYGRNTSLTQVLLKMVQDRKQADILIYK